MRIERVGVTARKRICAVYTPDILRIVVIAVVLEGSPCADVGPEKLIPRGGIVVTLEVAHLEAHGVA